MYKPGLQVERHVGGEEATKSFTICTKSSMSTVLRIMEAYWTFILTCVKHLFEDILGIKIYKPIEYFLSATAPPFGKYLY